MLRNYVLKNEPTVFFNFFFVNSKPYYTDYIDLSQYRYSFQNNSYIYFEYFKSLLIIIIK